MPSQADVQVWEQVGKAPAASLAHALRWFNQIASYTPAERKSWAAGVSPLTAGGKPTTAPAAADDDDDDVDLFGSGDEEEVRTVIYLCLFYLYLLVLFVCAFSDLKYNFRMQRPLEYVKSA